MELGCGAQLWSPFTGTASTGWLLLIPNLFECSKTLSLSPSRGLKGEIKFESFTDTEFGFRTQKKKDDEEALLMEGSLIERLSSRPPRSLLAGRPEVFQTREQPIN